MNDLLPQLPEFEPRADLWERIENDLNSQHIQSDERFKEILPQLPSFEPKLDVWAAIENELDNESTRPLWKQSVYSWKRAGLVAASVLLIVGVWLGLPSKQADQVRMEYIVEQAPKATGINSRLLGKQKAIQEQDEAFIAQQCALQRVTCQRPEVHELRNQLVELNQQQQRIERERQVFGDDPVLLRAQQKLDLQRTHVLNELVSILHS